MTRPYCNHGGSPLVCDLCLRTRAEAAEAEVRRLRSIDLGKLELFVAGAPCLCDAEVGVVCERCVMMSKLAKAKGES